MILVIKKNISCADIDLLMLKLSLLNLQSVLTEENGRYYVRIVDGVDTFTDKKLFLALPAVESVLPVAHKFKLASLITKPARTVIKIKDHAIGGTDFTVIAGPCSIESEENIHQTAAIVAAAGATILRGGAFKPRTSPYDFQGLGEIGLRYMQNAAKEHNLLCVSEVMDTQDLDLVTSYVDIVQIGARNMQNFSLLKQVGLAGKPVLLKRGLSATYHDFLMAAEYILHTGNQNVILCERGIRTFEHYTRNTLDIAAVPILQELTHLPIIVDPSHGTGVRSIVPAMAYAAMGARAHGIMVEVHPTPDKSISDAKQTISPATFIEMMSMLRKMGEVMQIRVKN